MIVALIDGDAIPYIIAYNMREAEETPANIKEAENSVDSFMDMIFTMTGATHYMAFIGNEERNYFRHKIYRYAEYKGNRPPEEEWFKRWNPVIRYRMESFWDFQSDHQLEADDLISYWQEQLVMDGQLSPLSCRVETKLQRTDIVICSPDKDLKQLAGIFYDYKKPLPENSLASPLVSITPYEAYYRLWLQVITGDATDNIAGVPGLGEIKGRKLLDAANDPMEYPAIARGAFCKYFGQVYGPEIFDQTVAAITLIQQNHPLIEGRRPRELAFLQPIKKPKTVTLNPFE